MLTAPTDAQQIIKFRTMLGATLKQADKTRHQRYRHQDQITQAIDNQLHLKDRDIANQRPAIHGLGLFDRFLFCMHNS